MKHLLTVFSTGFLVLCMIIGPSIAAVTERYCPLFKPNHEQVWDQHEKKWIERDEPNGFLIVSLAIYEIGCFLMIFVCGSAINDNNE